MNENKRNVLSGVFWKFAERISAQLVSLIVSIILARLLSPTEYGSVSLVTVFISIANVFVTAGFGTALIQKKDSDDTDFSTVFYFSLVFSLSVYCILFLLSSYISDFYSMPILKNVLRVLALSIIIMGINSVQQAYVAKMMIFKKFFYATLIGTITSGVVGIVLAYYGLGVWALVAQTLTNNVMDTIILQCSIDWRPKRLFSFARLRQLFSYGWKLLVQGLVLQLYTSLRSLIIGKLYTTSDLAYYTKGNQFPDLISTNVDTAINTAIFPAMSKRQESLQDVKLMARKTTQLTSYVMNPMLIGFAAIADQFISILLTDKWLFCVPYLRICCIVLLFRAPQTAILQAVKAVGRSDSVLKSDIPIRIFALMVLLISVRYGVFYFALSEIFITLFGTVLYSFMAYKILDYKPKEICSDFLINTFISVLMGMVVYIIGLMSNSYSIYLSLLFQIITGVVIYILLSVLSHNESFKYLTVTVNEICKGIQNRQ